MINSKVDKRLMEKQDVRDDWTGESRKDASHLMRSEQPGRV